MKSAYAGQNAVTYYIMFKHHWLKIPDPVSVSKSGERAVAAYSSCPYLKGTLRQWFGFVRRNTLLKRQIQTALSVYTIVMDAACREKLINAPYCRDLTYFNDIFKSFPALREVHSSLLLIGSSPTAVPLQPVMEGYYLGPMM